ncbi:11177_t:CDS:2 [Cetraspora pellucida]|uniref:11177_t:CDS:1 n=1 Tax=Cetraspora pellucida TaxID=1433469 RepID=A0ACA9LX36_9GLOM|nr:11177_t:CDS:2 [Cetraspora pellucida]
MVNNSSEYYQSNDFDFETTYIYLKQYNQFENSRTSSNLSTEMLPEIQTTLENKEKNNAYREKMSEFDTAFVVLESVSLTIEFWSSKAKYRYLGITVTWVTSNFEIKNVMLETQYVPSPHTSKIIINELYKFIELWNLKNHIISITTDSGANINVLNKVSLMVALLDPQYKSLDFLENNTEKQQVIQKLCDKLGEIEEITSEPNNLSPSNIETSTHFHKKYLQ